MSEDKPTERKMTAMELANECKTNGNTAFKAKNFPLAIKYYTEAVDLCPTEASFFSNRCAALLAFGQQQDDDEQLELALKDADSCVALRPSWAKAYIRRGAALMALGRKEEAIRCYSQGLLSAPADKTLVEALVSSQKNLLGLEEESSSSGKKKRKGKKGKKGGRDESKSSEDNKYVIGIDLGTTFSCVGVWKGDGVHIIVNEDGERTTPSYVAVDEEGNRFTGQQAKAMQARCPTTTVYDVKRIIGQRFDDAGVEKDIRSFPFGVQRGADDKPVISLPGRNGATELLAPEAISAMVLGRLKRNAEDYLGCAVQDAVITVPAYFNDAQRNATKAAGLIAGLNVLRIINEPTAAALSYGLDRLGGGDSSKGAKAATKKKNRKGGVNVLIFDLGGGTFDVSLLNIEQGVFKVMSTAGDTRLGGEDFDHAVVEALILEAENSMGFVGVRDNQKAFRRLRTASELAKRELSAVETTEIRIEGFAGTDRDFVYELTREKFEQINSGLFERCLDTVKRVLKDSSMSTDKVDEVVLVGGSTRVPKIQSMLSEYFGGKELCKSLNPDEAVAYGAAVQGAILSGTRHEATEDLLLMDVTPLSLGIETTGRVMSVIIPRNTPIPAVRTQVYTTEQDFQTAVDVSVYEGERLKTEENNLLGEFTISGIQKAKRGEPKVNVSFSIDSNGILSVKAVDQDTGAEANIEIANRSRASKEDIERMVKEAEKYRAEDQKRIARIENCNRLEETANEALEYAASLRPKENRLADIIEEAANRELVWLEAERDIASPGDIAVHTRDLAKRLSAKNRRK